MSDTLSQNPDRYIILTLATPPSTAAIMLAQGASIQHFVIQGPRSMNVQVGQVLRKAINNPSVIIVANTGAQSILRLVSNIVLARMLAPSAFALTAITALVLTGIQMVSDVGIAITALREGEMSRDDEDKLWTMQILRGLAVGIIVAVVAVPVGWIYHDYRLRDVLFALSLMPALLGAQSLYPVLALGHRRLMPSTIVELGGRIVSMAASILVALISPTVWALVVGTLVASMFAIFTSHTMARRWPKFIVDWGYIKNQWKFSRWIQTSSTLTFASMQIDKALFPFLYGMSALGLYGIGATFASMPSQVTQRWSSSVFYPLTVQLLRGNSDAKEKLIYVRITMLLYCAVASLLVMAVSPAFFIILYEPRYHAAAYFAEILALGAFFEIAESSLRHLPLVEGTPHYEVWTVLVRLAVFASCVGVVYAFGIGVIGYAIAYVVGLASSHLFMLLVCVRRGYLNAGPDVLLSILLIVSAVTIFYIPLHDFGTYELLGQACLFAILSGVLVLLIYFKRGLPSLPADTTGYSKNVVLDDGIET